MLSQARDLVASIRIRPASLSAADLAEQTEQLIALDQELERLRILLNDELQFRAYNNKYAKLPQVLAHLKRPR